VLRRWLSGFFHVFAIVMLMLGLNVAAYILFFPTLAAPYGIGTAVFAVIVASVLIWLPLRIIAYLLRDDTRRSTTAKPKK